MNKDDLCPECGQELNYDEVDIGVGTMRGNVHCDYCGWSQDDEVNSMGDYNNNPDKNPDKVTE